jgi:hypothetical protein
MSERKNERWLDDQLRRAIHGDTPRFDAQAWKQKHPGEYEKLVARGTQHVGWGLPHRNLAGRRLWWWGRLAVATAIVVGIGLFVLNRSENEPGKRISPPDLVSQSPTAMMSMLSLRLAYEQGGFDELDRQLQNTLDEFGPRSSGVSLQELF